MSAITHSPSSQEENISTASIYSNSVNDVGALREFLETNGCSVSVNTNNPEIDDYSIICGNADFVKTIISNTKINGKKSLIILFHVKNSEMNLFEDRTDKLIFTDPPPFDAPTVKNIFRFFFTSRDHTLNIATTITEEAQEETHEKPEQEIAETPKDDVPPNYFISSRAENDVVNIQDQALGESDKNRISETIATVFSNENKSAENSNVVTERINENMYHNVGEITKSKIKPMIVFGDMNFFRFLFAA